MALCFVPFFSTFAQQRIALSELNINLCNGDLVFCVSSHENAITESTVQDGNYPVFHVAIVVKNVASQIMLLHASSSKGVTLTSLEDFTTLYKKLLVGRLKDCSGIEKSLSNALSFINRPYDDLFMLDTNEIYCSELVQHSYVNDNGEKLFPLINMSFHGPDGKILDFWKKHYSSRGMDVPEGALGTNPAQIAQSNQLTLIFKTF